MTETVAETEAGWGEAPAPAPVVMAQAPVTYPEYGPLPEARISVNCTPGKAPMLTVRAHTAAELTAALKELEEGGVYAIIGEASAALSAQAAIGRGLGPTTPVPAGPPAPAPQGATPPPFGPNVSVPQAPGYQGPPVPQAPVAPAPGQWSGQAQGAGGNSRGPKPRPDWASVYKIDVPFPAKEQFKAFREQNKEYFKGKMLWAGGGAYWVEGSVVQAVANYTPVPA